MRAQAERVTPRAPRRRCRIIWVHKQTEHRASGAGWVSAQAMATAAGLAALEARSHLLMHPKLGPWLSLRSVLVFDAVRAPFAAPPRAVPLELSREVEERLRESLAARDARARQTLTWCCFCTVPWLRRFWGVLLRVRGNCCQS